MHEDVRVGPPVLHFTENTKNMIKWKVIWRNTKSMLFYEGYSPLSLLPKDKQEIESRSSALSRKVKDAQVRSCASCSPGVHLLVM